MGGSIPSVLLYDRSPSFVFSMSSLSRCSSQSMLSASAARFSSLLSVTSSFFTRTDSSGKLLSFSFFGPILIVEFKIDLKCKSYNPEFLSACHHVSLLSCHHDIMSTCQHVIMTSCQHVIMLFHLQLIAPFDNFGLF